MRDQFTPEFTRYLPHFHRPGATFFVTFRLHDSLPQDFLDKLSRNFHTQRESLEKTHPPDLEWQLYLLQRAYFHEFDQCLDRCEYGPTWLKDPEAAIHVVNQLNRWDGVFYDLIGYTILPNHVHTLLDFSIQLQEDNSVDTSSYRNLDYIMDRVKGASARYINQVLGRVGTTFWQAGYHDRYIRDNRHLIAALNYLKQNPVKARLCTHWMEHPFTWVR
jgi:REP element-mobilizing transposase RayT